MSFDAHEGLERAERRRTVFSKTSSRVRGKRLKILQLLHKMLVSHNG